MKGDEENRRADQYSDDNCLEGKSHMLVLW